MPNKLTDSEIVKALECFSNGVCGKCDYEDEDLSETILNALDLINRLQAENERLSRDVFTYKIRWAKATAKLDTAKAEAYKEFAKRLKEKAKPHYFDNYDFAVSIDEIGNLLKEMVGDDNG